MATKKATRRIRTTHLDVTSSKRSYVIFDTDGQISEKTIDHWTE
jgi:hypothetical protein